MLPIILAHGFVGFKRFLVWQHFNGVERRLRGAGYPAIQAEVHPTRSIEERSRQLLDCINSHIGAEHPFHIIGHSMGGIDARYLAAPNGLNQGHRIASVTTIGTPHRGSPIADRVPVSFVRLAGMGAWFGRWLPFDPDTRKFLSRLSEQRYEGLPQLKVSYMQETFNQQIIDHPAVRYLSFAGVIPSGKTIFPRTLSWSHIKQLEGDNDGLVSIASAQWGEFMGCLASDHGALVGLQIMPWMKGPFDHLAFFEQLAALLQGIEENDAPAASIDITAYIKTGREPQPTPPSLEPVSGH